jgi:hypothetical protein
VFYEDLEVAFNSGEVELPDDPKTQEQLLTLVVRGEKIDHMPGDHDDYANAVAGCVWLMRNAARLAAQEPNFRPPPDLSYAACGVTKPGSIGDSWSPPYNW